MHTREVAVYPSFPPLPPSWSKYSLQQLSNTLNLRFASVRSLSPCVIFSKVLDILRSGVVSPLPNTQAGVPLLVGCLQMLIQYICSYLLHVNAILSIRTQRMRHAVMTRDPLGLELK